MTKEERDDLIYGIVFAIVCPPLCAFAVVGPTKHAVINLILCFLGFFPAVLHALWLVLSNK